MNAELVGYAASILVAVSLTMSNIWRLRWVNLAGALLFAIYGLMIPAYPVFVVNGFIVVIDLYYLVQMATQRDFFGYLRIAVGQSRLLDKFVDFHRADIARYFPDFDRARASGLEGFFVLRNLMPVGLFLYESRPDGVLQIHLDYVIPDYRDLKNAQFLFSSQEHMAAGGFHSWQCATRVPEHRTYLERLGFRAVEGSETVYRKAL